MTCGLTVIAADAVAAAAAIVLPTADLPLSWWAYWHLQLLGRERSGTAADTDYHLYAMGYV